MHGPDYRIMLTVLSNNSDFKQTFLSQIAAGREGVSQLGFQTFQTSINHCRIDADIWDAGTHGSHLFSWELAEEGITKSIAVLLFLDLNFPEIESSIKDLQKHFIKYKENNLLVCVKLLDQPSLAAISAFERMINGYGWEILKSGTDPNHPKEFFNMLIAKIAAKKTIQPGEVDSPAPPNYATALPAIILRLDPNPLPSQEALSVIRPGQPNYQQFLHVLQKPWLGISLEFNYLSTVKPNNVYLQNYFANGGVIASSDSRDPSWRALARDVGARIVYMRIKLPGGKYEGGECIELFSRYLIAKRRETSTPPPSPATLSESTDTLKEDNLREFRNSLIVTFEKYLDEPTLQRLIRALEIYTQNLQYIAGQPIATAIKDLSSYPDYEFHYSNPQLNIEVDAGRIIAFSEVDVTGFFNHQSNSFIRLVGKIIAEIEYIEGPADSAHPEQGKWLIKNYNIEGPDADRLGGVLVENSLDFFYMQEPIEHYRWAILYRLYMTIEKAHLDVVLSLNDFNLNAKVEDGQKMIEKLPDSLYYALKKPVTDYFKACELDFDGIIITENLFKLFLCKLFRNSAKFLEDIENRLDELDSLFIGKPAKEIQQELIWKVKCLDELTKLNSPENSLNLLAKYFLDKCSEALASGKEFWPILEMALLYREVYEGDKSSEAKMLQALLGLSFAPSASKFSILGFLRSQKIQKACGRSLQEIPVPPQPWTCSLEYKEQRLEMAFTYLQRHLTLVGGASHGAAGGASIVEWQNAGRMDRPSIAELAP